VNLNTTTFFAGWWAFVCTYVCVKTKEMIWTSRA